MDKKYEVEIICYHPKSEMNTKLKKIYDVQERKLFNDIDRWPVEGRCLTRKTCLPIVVGLSAFEVAFPCITLQKYKFITRSTVIFMLILLMINISIHHHHNRSITIT